MQDIIQVKKDERALADILVAIVIGLYLTNVAVGIGRYVGFDSATISLAAKVLILGAIIRCALVFINRINFAMMLSTYILVFTIVVQGVFFPENRQFLLGEGRGSVMESTVATFVITILPAIYTIAVIQDFDILLRRLQNAAIGISAFTSAVILVYGGDAFEKYCMGFGIAMIFPTCLTITKAASSNMPSLMKQGCIALAVMDIFAITMYGNRGAFVAVVAFTVYYFLWEQIRQKKLIAILETGGILLVAGSYKQILKSINDFAQSRGYFSRTLMSLSSDKVSDSGRSRLYEPIQREILEAPLKIRGINSDWETVGFYCHNWALELLHAFGVLLGGFCCLMVLYEICKILWRGKTDSRSILLICLTFVFFPICLVSDSVWESTWFWTWLVLVLLPDSQNNNTTSSSMRKERYG